MDGFPTQQASNVEPLCFLDQTNFLNLNCEIMRVKGFFFTSLPLHIEYHNLIEMYFG